MKTGVVQAGLLMLVVTARVVAQSPSPEEWIVQTLRTAEGLALSTPIEVVWKVSAYPMSEQAVRSLQHSLVGRPDDPRQVELDTQRRRLQSGPDTTTTTLSFANSRLWRISSDIPYLDIRYRDEADNGDVRWIMDAQDVLLRDADDPTLADKRGDESARLRHFVSQGLTMALGDIAPEKVQVRATQTGPAWTAELIIDGGWTGSVSGEWTPDGQGAIKSIVLMAPGQPRPAFDLTVDGVVQDAVLGVRRASAITNSAGNAPTRYEFLNSRSIDISEVKQRVKTPDPTGSDVTRGPVTAIHLSDHRSGAIRLSHKHDGEWKVITEQVVEDGRSRVRYAGWTLAGLFAVALVTLRVRALRARG